ncbi:MAG: ribosome small subunit-dependent GTPase A [candidate division Zixibacteria bacterium]|nr:ribosome small subunit-dependent GTPase A [candidate division Zixibacteria bacterium]
MSEPLDGIVTRGHGNRFTVFANGEYISCQIRGKVKFNTEETTPVAVGDNVKITLTDNNEGVIEEVLPRYSVLSRQKVAQEGIEHVLAANIDSLIVVASIKKPALKVGLIDRFIIAAQLGNLTPVIVLNKADLGIDDEIKALIEDYRKLNYKFFVTSAIDDSSDGNEIDKFHDYLIKHRSILAGHSGVGKSTLLNRLYPGLNLKVADISKGTNRGRHTTSHIELFHLPDGGFVIDSPGIKVLGLWHIEKEDLVYYYHEMESLLGQCRFAVCTHTHEPDCAVKKAVSEGSISKIRYQNYLQIYESLDV